MMKLLKSLLILIFMMVITVGCDQPVQGQAPIQAPKYDIENLSDMVVFDSDFEKLYDKSKNAAFAWIDSLEETDFLPAEKCYLMVNLDKSAVFLLRTKEKPGIKDNTVMITYSYLPNEKSWKRGSIIYNKQEYGAE